MNADKLLERLDDLLKRADIESVKLCRHTDSDMVTVEVMRTNGHPASGNTPGLRSSLEGAIAYFERPGR